MNSDRLAEERRARLAAELMLEQVQSELSAANEKIAASNRALSDEIVVKREEVEQVRTEAETLRDENEEVKSDLERAESAIMIAERRLWDSLETIQDGFAVFDPSGMMIAANRAYLAAFEGLEMIGPGIQYPDMLTIMTEEGIVDLEGRAPSDWREMMLDRWQSDKIEPVTVKLWNGAFVKVIDRRTRDGDMVSLGLNITSTIRREAELEDARAKAEAANRAKSAFLANMSHEIRTPMNGVIGMADMLGETHLDEEQRLFVETIRNSGEALLVIINDVLDYSKIEAKKLELHPTEFDLERCIHEVLMLLQPTAHDKGLQLAVDYDMFMPTQFVGDPGRVRQILTNLAGNAVKFTQEGHVAIRVVGLPIGESEAYRVHLTVEDTGIGIPPEKVKSVFGEFSQVEDERNRRYDGTGLGLAITKRLVELMEGEIWVDSEVGVGSGFGFHITMPVPEDAESHPIIAPEWINRAIVLDEPRMTRAVLTKQIGAMGLKVVAVQSGGEFERLDLSPRDVIILGDLSVVDQIGHILAQPGAPQAILLSSVPLAGSEPLGVAATLQKPAQRRDIARVLSALTVPEETTTDEMPEAMVLPQAVGQSAPVMVAPEAETLTAPGMAPGVDGSMGAPAQPMVADTPVAQPGVVGEAVAPSPVADGSAMAPAPAMDMPAPVAPATVPDEGVPALGASPTPPVGTDVPAASESTQETAAEAPAPSGEATFGAAPLPEAPPSVEPLVEAPAPMAENPAAPTALVQASEAVPTSDLPPAAPVAPEAGAVAAPEAAQMEPEFAAAPEAAVAEAGAPQPVTPAAPDPMDAQDHLSLDPMAPAPEAHPTDAAAAVAPDAALVNATADIDTPASAPLGSPSPEVPVPSVDPMPAGGLAAAVAAATAPTDAGPAPGEAAPRGLAAAVAAAVQHKAKLQTPVEGGAVPPVATAMPASAEAPLPGTPVPTPTPEPALTAEPAPMTAPALTPSPEAGAAPEPADVAAAQVAPTVMSETQPEVGTSADADPVAPALVPNAATPVQNLEAATATPAPLGDVAATPPVSLESDPAALMPMAPGATADTPLRQMRVLVAEDNKTNRLVFSKMVQSLDIEIEFAENGLEAVAAFDAAVPDMIFTDISMPEMDGKEASRHIRQMEADRGLARTPIVAITAHAMAGDAEEILAAGIDSYLTKPLKRAALVAAITAAKPADVVNPVPAGEVAGMVTAQPGAEPVANMVAE